MRYLNRITFDKGIELPEVISKYFEIETEIKYRENPEAIGIMIKSLKVKETVAELLQGIKI